MRVFKRLIDWFKDLRKSRRLRKRMQKYRDRDPFIYR